MALPPHEPDRRVVPRWRPLKRLYGSELASTGSVNQEIMVPDTRFAEKFTAWENEPTLENASDVVTSAIVSGHREQVLPAAKQILAVRSDATDALKNLAHQVAVGQKQADVRPIIKAFDFAGRQQIVRAQLKNLRARIKAYPRNAFLWGESARLYSMLGQNLQSSSAMNAAAHLAPDNRYILRSASRLFVHLEEPDRAHDLLISSTSTQGDPWLLSAEIAVGSVANRSTRFIKIARSMLGQGKYSESETSELASAVATLEFSGGANRKARQLFRRSIIRPTDNSVAQAEWASHLVSGLDVKSKAQETPLSYEARAGIARYDGDADSVIENCQDWAEDEPFSVRPFELGSYVAVAVIRDFELGEKFARSGLIANPGNIALLNNLTVALANKGDMTAADDEFFKIERSGISEEIKPALLATEGLLHFRHKRPEMGQQFYMEAMEKARRLGFEKSRLLALIHLVREEIRVGSNQSAPLLKDARKEIADLKFKELENVLAALEVSLPTDYK